MASTASSGEARGPWIFSPRDPLSPEIVSPPLPQDREPLDTACPAQETQPLESRRDAGLWARTASTA